MHQGLDEIIAIRFKDDKILFGMEAVNRVITDKTYTQLLSKAEFRLLTYFDLGAKWAKYADIAPVLFKLDGWDMNVRAPGLIKSTGV